MESQWLLIATALFLVLLNGYFVASEFAIVKVRETRIQELIQQGQRRATRANRLISSMDEYLSATQLGITLASLGLGWIGEPAFAAVFEPLFGSLGATQPVVTHSLAVITAFLLITFMHIVLGELAPKSLAIQRAEGVILWAATPLIGFYWAAFPLIWALNGMANLFLRLIGIAPVSENAKAHSEEELRLIVAHSHREGVLSGEEKALFERVMAFSDRLVRQVMVPTPDVVFLDVQKSLDENLKTAQEARHTRYPLCDGSLEKVVGVIHMKDLLWMMRRLGADFELSMAKRTVHFVPDSKPIRALLRDFRKTRTHLAVAVDEFGSTAGILTLEDILEELVGEIQDEFDPAAPSPVIRKSGDNVYLVHGRALLEDLEKTLELRFQDDENDTIAGHILMLLGRMAKVGDQVEVAGRYRVRVLGIKGFQITDLRFEPLGSAKSREVRSEK